MNADQVTALLFTVSRLVGEATQLVRQVAALSDMGQAEIDVLLKNLSQISDRLAQEASRRLRG
jgi:hypothetical protein